MLEAYIQEVNGFKLVTKMADYLSAVTGSDEDTSSPHTRKDEHYRKELKLKLQIPVSAHSLSYVDEVWNSLAKQFLLPPSSAILDKIIEGSVYVTWLIPAFFVPQMMDMAEQPEVMEFFQEMKTDIATVDGAYLYGEQEVYLPPSMYGCKCVTVHDFTSAQDEEDSSDNTFQEPSPEMITAADSFQEESAKLVADQHHDTQV